MAKKFFETPVVKTSYFQTKDVIAASGMAGDFTNQEGDELAKSRIANPAAPAAGTIKKSGLTW